MGEHIRKILILKVFIFFLFYIQFVHKDLGFPKGYLNRQVITIEKGLLSVIIFLDFGGKKAGWGGPCCPSPVGWLPGRFL